MLRRRPIARAAVGTAVVAGTATAVSGRVSRRQNARSEAQAPEAAATAAPPPTAPQAPAPAAQPAVPDPIAQLKELAELRDRGVVTEEEFQRQKARILG